MVQVNAPRAAPVSVNHSSSPGSLVLVGGRLESDNLPLFEVIGQRCHNRIAVLATASEYPDEVGEDTVTDFLNRGIDAELVPLAWEDRAVAAFSASVVDRLLACGSVFFTGGDQSRILDTLIQDGRETPALQAIRRLHETGGLIAGTSAGAAAMSDPMIAGGTSLDALNELSGPVSGTDFHLSRGLGFFTWGLVDQHFLKRGRLARLVVASRRADCRFGFGIDENTGLLVERTRARVIGETGVVMVDLRHARFDEAAGEIRGVRLSFLDAGDTCDLLRGRIRPAPDKKRMRASRASYRTPAVARRHAFSSYALHDLMLRLVEGDPAHYSRDALWADDREQGCLFRIELARIPRRSRVLRARRADGARYTAVNFDLNISSQPLTQPLSIRVPVPAPTASDESRLILLGDSPLRWESQAQRDFFAHLVEPVGVVPAASGHPQAATREYLDWLNESGIEADALDINAWNIESASRDRDLLRRIAQSNTLLIAGGDQRRLTETLLHCADATPVLQAMLKNYQNGGTLVGVGGAAAAFGVHMIAEGSSCDALRHGASEDAGAEGIVIEPGLGLVDFALIDQNFLHRQRLGRLLVACAEASYGLGFGICEEAGLVVSGGDRRVRAIGRRGIVVVTVDPARIDSNSRAFSASGVGLRYLRPGDSFDPGRRDDMSSQPSDIEAVMLRKAVDELEMRCARDSARLTPELPASWLRLALKPGPPAVLDVRTQRA